jgi:hypothetical protein
MRYRMPRILTVHPHGSICRNADGARHNGIPQKFESQLPLSDAQAAPRLIIL